MASKFKPLFPWAGGLNTSQDAIILDPQNLTVADNIIFTTSGSRRKRGGQSHYNSTAIGTSSASILYFTSYWGVVSNVKRERFVTVDSNGKVYRNTPGATSFASFSTLVLTVSQGGITSEVMNNNLVMGFQGNGVPKVWVGQSTSVNLVSMTSSTTVALPFTTAWICRSFIERMFVAGDPALPDRLYVSVPGTYNNFTQGAVAGSGIVLDIGIGDGDPSGITAIFPGTGANRVVYVAKRRHLYAIDCSNVDQRLWSITLISNQIGVINPNAVVTLDETDIIFMSDRGVHSLSQVLQTTAVIPGEFLSFPIQPDYNEVINGANRSQISLVYVPSLNSVLFSCKRVGVSTYETIYGFNIELKQWFRWTSVPCNYITTRFNTTTGLDELYACAPSGFINKLNQTTLADFGAAISSVITSSFIFPDGIPLMEYNFLNLILVFRSRDTSTFTVQYTIDGVINDSFVVQQKTAGGNILGTTLLGSTFILGRLQGVKPYFAPLAGVGSSIQITITHNTASKDIDLFGMVLEYENAGDQRNPYNNSAYN